MEDFEKLKQMLMCDEGVAFTPYKCTSAKLTVGVGRNLDDTELDFTEISLMLSNDIYKIYQILNSKFAWFCHLNEARQMALVNMCFNIGFAGFCSFKNMLAALEHGNWLQAGEEVLNSRYATQVKDRARRIAHIIVEGEIPKDWYNEYQIIR